MKKLLYTLALLLPILVLGQSTDQNFVKSTTYKKAIQDTIEALAADKIEQVTYYDGLGRPIQTNAYKAGGNGQDIISHVEYDALGRQAKTHLPYAVTGAIPLDYRTGTSAETDAYYEANYADDLDALLLNPFSEVEYEASPLNRVMQQAAPGKDWSLTSGHTIKFDYQANTDNDSVKYFKATFVGNEYMEPQLVYNNYYAAAELYKTITKDENWTIADGKSRTTEEFKDKQGRVILKRTYVKDSLGTIDVELNTQYIYDEFGNLTYVLSPEASDSILTGSTINTLVLDNLGYQYKYDNRNRLIEKKIPGKGKEYIIYDNLDRPILTQDQNLKALNKWLFTKYDGFGRVVYTGFYNINATRVDLQTQATAFVGQPGEIKHITSENPWAGNTIGGTVLLYTYQRTFPFDGNNLELLTINYYDDYKFDTTLSLDGSSKIVNDPQNGVEENNGIIYKTGIYGWNASFDTEATITGDGGISYTVIHDSNTSPIMVGLTDVNNTPDNHYNTMGYAIYTGYFIDNKVGCYENGIAKYFTPPNFYQVGDIFSVERSENQMLYKKNGEVFYALTITDTSTLVGDSSFLYNGGAISNVMVYYTVESTPITANNKGLATGSKVRVLDTNDWITTATHYDEKARPIYVASDNPYLQTSDAVSSVYDFIGNVKYSKAIHTKTGQTTILTEDVFAYDHQNRLLAQKQSINGGSYTTIVANEYDALGQLKAKKTGVQNHTTSENLANLVNVFKEGEYLTKVTDASWTGNIESVDKITGDGFVEYTVTATDKINMIGLSDPTGTLSNAYDKIDYAIYTGYGTTKAISIYEEGDIKILIPAVYFEAGDTFRVERIGTTISYQKNGVEFDFTPNVTPNDLIVDGCLGALGSYIKDLYLADINIIEGQALQTVDYNYNIRGWLKDINDIDNLGLGINTDLFAFRLNYNTKDLSNSTELFNGNIAETQWKSVSDNNKRYYSYEYDALNRIKKGVYNEDADVTANNRYGLSGISYDKNGNIKTLNRNGLVSTSTAPIDYLTYNYFPNSNQLKSVVDFSIHEGFKDGNTVGDDYAYDDNGNMTVDNNKKITDITYNHLNLPVTVTFENNNPNISGAGIIEYVYDATGVKLKKYSKEANLSSGRTTFYAGNFVYTQGSGQSSTTLEFFNHTEGYIEKNTNSTGGKKPIITTSFTHVYQYKDHLGNIRLSYADDNRDGHIAILRGNTDIDGDYDYRNEIREESNYYPFGLKHKGYNNVITGRDHKFDYNGMEFNEELGLNWHDYGARNYDASLGRWMNVDPLSETSRRFSPYAYALNNPIFYIDPDGMQATDWYENGDGNIVYDENITSQQDLDDAGIDGEYIAESFVGIDQNQSVKSFNEDGTISSSSQDEIGENDTVIAIESSQGDMTKDMAPSKGQEFSTAATAAVVTSQGDSPLIGPADLLAAGMLYNALKNLITPAEVDGYFNLEFAKTESEKVQEQEDRQSNVQHSSSSSKSTKQRHTDPRSGGNTGNKRNNKKGKSNKKYKKKVNPNKYGN